MDLCAHCYGFLFRSSDPTEVLSASPTHHLVEGKTTKSHVSCQHTRCTALITMFNVCVQCCTIGVQSAVLRIINPPTHSCGRWIKHHFYNFTRGNNKEAVKSEDD